MMFFKSFAQNFFIQVFLSFNKQQLPLVFQKQVMFHSKKKLCQIHQKYFAIVDSYTLKFYII